MKIKLFYFCYILFINGLLAQNLIINGNAENSPFTDYGWVIESGNWTQRMNNPLPQNGNNYFFAGANSLAVLFQEIDVSNNATLIDEGNQIYVFSCYLRSFPQSPADETSATVEYLNGSGNVLYAYSTGFQSSTNQWSFFEDTTTAPQGTRTIKITLTSIRNNGNNNDGYFDNLKLTLNNTLSVEEIIGTSKQFNLYPNPSNNFIQIVGLEEKTNFIIYNTLGSELMKGNISKEDKINIDNLDNGLYFLILGKRKALKFLRN